MRNKQPFDVESLVKRSTSSECFICEYLRSNPGYDHVLVQETESAIAFLNKYPTLFGYVLVAPKRHLVDVTGSFSETEYLELQSFVYRVSEAVRKVLNPARVYILSLGSRQANEHVHWHVAPLPEGVPLEQQQYHALMHENGVVDYSGEEMQEYAANLRNHLI